MTLSTRGVVAGALAAATAVLPLTTLAALAIVASLGACGGGSSGGPGAGAGGNTPPVANGAFSTTGPLSRGIRLVGMPVTLSSNSVGADGKPLPCHWALVTMPAGSRAVIANPDTYYTYFTPDLPGSYSVSLVVSDGAATSKPWTGEVLVEAVPSANRPPTVSNVAVTPNPATASDVLHCTGSPSDPDGNPTVLGYGWTINNSDSSTSESADTSGPHPAGTRVACTIIVSDGYAQGMGRSATMTVGGASGLNHAPTVSQVQIAPAQPSPIDVLTCNATLADPDGDHVTARYSWTVNGAAAGSAQTAGPFPLGSPVTCAVTPNDGKADGPSAVANLTVSGGTVVTPRTIAQNITWTKESSPYIIAGKVFVDYPYTLTVGPGVTIARDPSLPAQTPGAIQVLGTLRIAGSASAPVVLTNVDLLPSGMAEDRPHLIDISHATISGCAVHDGYGGYGSLLVRDSRLSSVVGQIWVDFPSQDSFIERNVLDGVKIGGRTCNRVDCQSNLRWGRLIVRNNVFRNGAMVESNVASELPFLVERNTFATASSPVVRLAPGWATAAIDARNNYWGGMSDAEVPSMIYDRNDDPTCGGTIPYLPTLAAPDAATPTP